MRRRDFIKVIGGTAAWPLAARAQQPVMPVIGFLHSGSSDLFADRLRAFHQGLSETGHVDSRNVMIDYRWANYDTNRLPELATELVRRRVAVIAAPTTPAAFAVKAVATTIPTVFSIGTDPVAAGLVASLNRPGGNLTGVTTLSADLVPKRLELLHEMIPTATVIALLVNPTSPTLAETESRNLEAAARRLGLQVHVLQASTERDFETVFATTRQLGAGALIISADALFVSRSAQLAALAIRDRVPAIYQERTFAAAGGLMSYGGNITDQYRQIGIYAGRILKGEKPAVMPVHQMTKVELILNLKTAKALGLTVSLPLLGRADEVIE